MSGTPNPYQTAMRPPFGSPGGGPSLVPTGGGPGAGASQPVFVPTLASPGGSTPQPTPSSQPPPTPQAIPSPTPSTTTQSPAPSNPIPSPAPPQTGPAPAPPPPPPPPPSQQQKEINTASLCRLGQETVQEIVSRTQEVFQALKAMQPPNGTASGATGSAEKKSKLQEQLRSIRMLFKRLRLIYDKCDENYQGTEYTHIESLIPLREDLVEGKAQDERKNSEAFRIACEENREIVDQIMIRNRHLKEIIDHLRSVIWDINTMLAMRRV